MSTTAILRRIPKNKQPEPPVQPAAAGAAIALPPPPPPMAPAAANAHVQPVPLAPNALPGPQAPAAANVQLQPVPLAPNALPGPPAPPAVGDPFPVDLGQDDQDHQEAPAVALPQQDHLALQPIMPLPLPAIPAVLPAAPMAAAPAALVAAAPAAAVPSANMVALQAALMVMQQMQFPYMHHMHGENPAEQSGYRYPPYAHSLPQYVHTVQYELSPSMFTPINSDFKQNGSAVREIMRCTIR